MKLQKQEFPGIQMISNVILPVSTTFSRFTHTVAKSEESCSCTICSMGNGLSGE